MLTAASCVCLCLVSLSPQINSSVVVLGEGGMQVAVLKHHCVSRASCRAFNMEILARLVEMVVGDAERQHADVEEGLTWCQGGC